MGLLEDVKKIDAEKPKSSLLNSLEGSGITDEISTPDLP